MDEQQGVTLNSPLVDKEGYPLAIDVHGVRNARNRIHHLTNDHKAIMKDIEKALHAVHSVARVDSSASKPQ